MLENIDVKKNALIESLLISRYLLDFSLLYAPDTAISKLVIFNELCELYLALYVYEKQIIVQQENYNIVSSMFHRKISVLDEKFKNMDHGKMRLQFFNSY